MTQRDCERVRDLLPDWTSGSISSEEVGAVEEHLRSCGSCQAELDVIEAIGAAKPGVPQDLAARIQSRVRSEFAGQESEAPKEGGPEMADVVPIRGIPRRMPAWALSAAAVVVLALGTSLIWNQRNSEAIPEPVALASQEPVPEAWLWDDGMVAGAPVFDGLSDEDLEALLKEYEG